MYNWGFSNMWRRWCKYCKVCVVGYYVDNNKKCQSCTSSCANCESSPIHCLTCIDGFELDKDAQVAHEALAKKVKPCKIINNENECINYQPKLPE